MEAAIDKVTSWEISRYMLEQGKPVTAREVAKAMKERHPNLIADQRAIYLRMRSICQSSCTNGIMNKSTRPMTFHLTYISDAYFLGRISSGRMDEHQRKKMFGRKNEKHQLEGCGDALRLFNELVRRRMA